MLISSRNCGVKVAFAAIALGAGLIGAGCSGRQAPIVAPPTVAQRIDSLAKDPTISPAVKQGEIAALKAQMQQVAAHHGIASGAVGHAN